MVAKSTKSAIDSVTERVQELFEQKRRAIVDMDVLGTEALPTDLMQAKPLQQAIFILEDLHKDRPRTLVGRELPVRFNTANRREAVIPDVCFADDVDLELILTPPFVAYNIWEVGKPPEFALEIASPNTYRADVNEKPDIYQRIGITEYWMFDSTGGDYYGQSLRGYRMVDGSYRDIEMFRNQDGLVTGYSEMLKLNLCSAEMEYRAAVLSSQPNFVFQRDDYNPVQLLIQDPETGLYLLNTDGRREAEREAMEARLRAESRAQDAESRAQEAEAELARLRERINRMEQA